MTKLQKAEDAAAHVDQGKLSKDQQETFSTIRSFIAGAKDALAANDLPKAGNLVDKAQTLTDDLLRAAK